MNFIKIILIKYPTLIQFSKFCIVGVINTAIDFGVLNLLMYFSGIYKGPQIAIFNVISFTVAVINSYALNKYWTFKEKKAGAKKVPKQFFQYLCVSIIGITINTSIVYSVATYVSPLFGFSVLLWANFAKGLATAVSLFWNFIGYKFIVFKK